MCFDRHVDFGSRDKKILVDLHKMSEGMLDAVVMVAYLEQLGLDDEELQAATAKADRILDEIEAMVEKNKTSVDVAYTPADVRRLKDAGKKAVFVGIENGYAIGKDIRNVARFRKRGVIYMTLCHNGNNLICGSAKYNDEEVGVTAFGERTIREMNRVGMMIDISHAGRHTFYDALDISESRLPFFRPRAVRPSARFGRRSAKGVSEERRRRPSDAVQRLPSYRRASHRHGRHSSFESHGQRDGY